MHQTNSISVVRDGTRHPHCPEVGRDTETPLFRIGCLTRQSGDSSLCMYEWRKQQTSKQGNVAMVHLELHGVLLK